MMLGSSEFFVKALVNPRELLPLKQGQWFSLIRYAKRAGLLARLQVLLEENQLIHSAPEPVRAHLESARTVSDNEHRIIWWEINRINRVLEDVADQIILLKGAAYTALHLPNSKGRISTDVDILMPKELVEKVEKLLLDNGWAHIKLKDYDQYYYRTWSHELPPLRHKARKTVLDIHHTILPLTGRLKPDPQKLIDSAISISGLPNKSLSPTDIILHSAAHSFQDGECLRILRDLIDLDEMIRFYDHQPKFWEHLVSRAQELNLTRPLYYGLRYAQKILGTSIPPSIQETVQSWRSPYPALALMDLLVQKSLEAPLYMEKPFTLKGALFFLYIRAHWLRMPFSLLCKHLLYKKLENMKGKDVNHPL